MDQTYIVESTRNNTKVYIKHNRKPFYKQTDKDIVRNAYKVRVLVSITRKQHIKIIEILKEPEQQDQQNSNNCDLIEDALRKHIEADSIVAYVDAYVKDGSFGGHVYISDTTNQYVEQWSIGSNSLVNS